MIETKPTTSDYQKILDMEFTDPDEGDRIEVREYFCAQLRTLWRQGEGFSGKRPLGNSGWESCLQVPLVQAGLLQGELVEDDGQIYAEDVTGDYNAHVDNLILVLCGFEAE